MSLKLKKENRFVDFLSNPKYNNFIYKTEATITIVNKSFEPESEIKQH
jgi:hypothetical protein